MSGNDGAQRKRPSSQKNSTERKSNDDDSNVIERVAIFLSYAALIVFFPLAIFFSVLIVAEYERVVLMRLGRLRPGGARGPGIVFYLPCVDEEYYVDLRIGSFNVPPQEILTKDSVTIKVDAVVYYRIMDPIKSVIKVVNVKEATEFLAQTTLRNVTGSKLLADLLSSRDELSIDILHLMAEATAAWGVKIERVELRDIALPVEMQRALAQEAEALREAKAKLIAASGEMEASKNLKAASDIIKDSPITLQLRYLQTLSIVAQEQNATIIFPVPIDVLPPGLV